jgi:hypothetical protein
MKRIGRGCLVIRLSSCHDGELPTEILKLPKQVTLLLLAGLPANSFYRSETNVGFVILSNCSFK